MEGYHKFEHLTVWQVARKFHRIICAVSGDFPDHERFSLTNQIRRASLSIMLNIAEGSQRGSDKEFVRFLRISHSSLLEVVSCCYAAKDQQYLSSNRFQYLYRQSHVLAKKINALTKYLNKC